MDPKGFYDGRMVEKLGPNYESARWNVSAMRLAQYSMIHRLVTTRVIPFLATPASVLEIGPGPGTWTKVLRDAFPKTSFTLVDISSAMLLQARTALGNSVEFIEADIAKFSSAVQYDACFSSRAFEYMPDKAVVLRVLFRSLKPGGRGVIITKTPKPLLDFLAGRKLSELHRGQITPRALSVLLTEAGFVVGGVRMATASIPLFRSAWLNRVAFRIFSILPMVTLLEIFSESYAVFFRKPL